MNQQELRTLRILEEIEKDGTPSQRAISRKLNISLGLVNSFFKRLALKGYCKVTAIPKNRVRYILTGKGAAEKTRLTYEYIQSSIEFYRKALHTVRKLFSELCEDGNRYIVFFGASDLAEISYLVMKEYSIELVGIIDDKKIGQTFLNRNIVGSNQITRLSFDRILITDIIDPIETFKEISTIGIPKYKIVMI